MGRRKRNLMEDDNSSGSSENDEGRGVSDRGDPDARDEQELFADPYRRAKRYRKGGKEDSILGIFARSEDEEDNLPSRLSGGRKPKYTKPVSFVSGSTGPAEAVDPDEVQSDHEPANNLGTSDESEGDVNMEDGEDGDEEPEEPEESERPGLGLSSFSASHFSSPIVTSSAAPHGDGSADSIPRTNRAGIGARDGLGSSSATKKGLSSASASFAGTLSAGDTSLPTSFGSPNTASASFANRARTSFVRDSANAAMSPKTAAQLTAEDQRHLQKLSGSFGAKMMEKMGWTPGEGIGLSNVGIATPIEVKLRPKSAGLAFQGFRERTDQSIREARRRGEAVSDEEIDTGGSKGKGKSKGRGGEKDRSNAWKKPKKTITRIKHMTYEEIIAESDETVPTSSLGVIIDATGATPREISSIADVSSASWIPSVEAERIPEVRHNLRILWSSAKSEFEGLVKEAKALEERKKWLKDEETRLRKVMVAEDIALSRLREISQIVERINLKSQGIASYEANLDVLAEEFDKLAIDYSPDYDKYELDEVVVGAIAPYVKRYTSQWKPLEAPSVLADDFRRWRKLFRMSHSKCDHAPLSSVGYLSPARASSKNGNASMTHYESLLWNVWLPRLRSTINNDWNVSNPSPLIRVLEAWSDLLPPFMLDNILDQLVLPKVQKALSDWSWTGEVALQSLVLPWLPHIGLRMEFLLDDTRRKLRSFLKSWKVEQGVPSDFVVWKEVLKAREWEDLLLKYIVPKLGAHLREKFTVNPAQQDMEPLLRISAWITILRPATFSQLLEMEFFPKWLSVLHMWLTQPGSDYNEVNEWYRFWKGSFSQEVLDLPRVSEGFARGLQLMNQATGLSPQARASLPKPDISNLSAKLPAEKTIPLKENRPVPEEVTFRSIVEEFVAEHNLFFVPMGKAHPKARLPLYRISQSVDGRGGVPVYISDDVVWALPVGGSDDDTYEPVMLDELVLRDVAGFPVNTVARKRHAVRTMSKPSPAQVLLAKADKKYNSSTGWFSSSASKYEEAGDLYQQAANAFKLEKLFKESGDAFAKEADCRDKQGERDEAANAWWNAAKAYKQGHLDLAITALSSTVTLLTHLGRFRQAADREKEVAQLYLQELKDLGKACESLERAGEWYSQEDAKATANGCFKDAADLHAELNEFPAAIARYEQVANHSLTSSLTKYSVKEYWLRAGLCALANHDTVTAQRNLNKYGTQDVTFPSTREAKFLNVLINTIDNGDEEAFTAAIVEYDQISKLDNWKTNILLKIKRSIQNEEDNLT